jgi:hypothetical protein
MRRPLRLGVLLTMIGAPALATADEGAGASSAHAAPGPAPAKAASDPDVLYLRDGGMFRGRATEIVPGSHVTLRLASGETKRFSWGEVDRVIVAAPSVPPPPTAGARRDDGPPMVGPRARVHIASDKPVILYRKPAGTNAWTLACTSPCGVELPLGDTYYLTGSRIGKSKELKLKASPGGEVELTVDPPSDGGMVIGGIISYGGFITAYAGLLATLVGLASPRTRSDVRDGGLIALAAGSAVAGLGLLIFLNSATTDVDQEAGGSRAASATRAPLDAFLRAPTWKAPAESAAASVPAATYPVLFERRF